MTPESIKNENNWLERTKLLVKDNGLNALQNSNILVVGLGGVGGFTCEFLARSGVGSLTIVDGDSVDLTNKNRQLLALDSNIGKNKAQVMEQRLLQINSNLNLTVVDKFLEPEDAYNIVNTSYDYVADCIDSISPKINIIKACRDLNVKLISSMGAGGVLDQSQIAVADISKTRNCPLARHIRKRLKKEGGNFKFKAVFSNEIADESSMQCTSGDMYKKSFYGTISYIPASFGIAVASHIIRYLLTKNNQNPETE